MNANENLHDRTREAERLAQELREGHNKGASNKSKVSDDQHSKLKAFNNLIYSFISKERDVNGKVHRKRGRLLGFGVGFPSTPLGTLHVLWGKGF